MLSKQELQELELEAVRETVDLSHWQDAAATEDIDTVEDGDKYVITEITVQNLGAASVLDFYDAESGDAAEANHKISIDIAATDTTSKTGLKIVFSTAMSVAASVCAAAHNLKIHLGGYRVKA